MMLTSASVFWQLNRPLWGVHDKIDDHAGFYSINSKMKECGFAGTAALTPKQIAMANAIYSLSPKEEKWVQNVQNNGTVIKLIRPSVQESRQMIGPPHQEKSSNMLKQYPRIKYNRNTSNLSPIKVLKGFKLIHPEEDLSMVSLNTGSEELQWKLR